MSFDLTDEQRSFRDVLHRFVDERVAPNAARYDREQVFPQDSFDACVEMELPALGMPEAYGGAGANMVTQAIMAEEVARGGAKRGAAFARRRQERARLAGAASDSGQGACPVRR